jgi:type I restriction enzyme S subunit
MSSCTISSIGKVIRGVSWDKADASDTQLTDYLPILRAGNIGADLNIKDDLVWVPASNVSDEQKIRAADIAICMSSGSLAVVGKTASSAADWQGGVGAFCALIRANPAKCLPEYLAFFLKSHRFRKWTSESQGANIKNIRKSDLERFEIWIPPLDEQRRIVDILSRAEGIVRLRREAENKAAELMPALFLDIFGDPATNPKGLALRKVSEFVCKFEGGKNIQAGSENGSPYRILKVSAVTSGVYRELESKPSPDGYTPPVSHLVRECDMLFSRANTEELVGATALVGKTNGKTLLPDKLWRFVWSEPVESTYMHALFQSNHVRKGLGKLSSGTSASMRNISQGKLFDFTLPVAPYAEQIKFAEKAAMICSIQSQQSDATAKAQAAFDALLAQVF